MMRRRRFQAAPRADSRKATRGPSILRLAIVCRRLD
jgi:hypothetical protein